MQDFKCPLSALLGPLFFFLNLCLCFSSIPSPSCLPFWRLPVLVSRPGFVTGVSRKLSFSLCHKVFSVLLWTLLHFGDFSIEKQTRYAWVDCIILMTRPTSGWERRFVCVCMCVWNAPLIEATRASLSRCRFPSHVELCLSQLNLHTLHHAGISYVVLLFDSGPCFLLVGLFVEQNCTVKCTWESLEAALVSVCTHRRPCTICLAFTYFSTLLFPLLQLQIHIPINHSLCDEA